MRTLAAVAVLMLSGCGGVDPEAEVDASIPDAGPPRRPDWGAFPRGWVDAGFLPDGGWINPCERYGDKLAQCRAVDAGVSE